MKLADRRMSWALLLTGLPTRTIYDHEIVVQGIQRREYSHVPSLDAMIYIMLRRFLSGGIGGQAGSCRGQQKTPAPRKAKWAGVHHLFRLQAPISLQHY